MVTPASVKLMAPMKGAVMGLHDVAAVFSGLLGGVWQSSQLIAGLATNCWNGYDGLPNEKHAIGLTDDHGMEVLIHVGLDTVSLNGEPFEALVAKQDRVGVGTELLQADLDAIKAAGLPTTTVVVITNTGRRRTLRQAGLVTFHLRIMSWKSSTTRRKTMHKRLLQLTHHWHKREIKRIKGNWLND